MVAYEGQPLALDDLVDAALRIPAVADNITKTQGLIDRWAVTQHGFQRLPVGVDVRQKRDSHAGRSYRRG